MQKSEVEPEQTIPVSLLQNPSRATDYQNELMRGIAHAEANGFAETRRALSLLLQASVKAHGRHLNVIDAQGA